MTIESVTHINDLDDTYPAGTDVKSEGDNHIRNIKTALTNDLPNIGGTVSADHTDLNRTDVTTEGTAQASKVVTTDSNVMVKSLKLDEATCVFADAADVTKTLGVELTGATTSTKMTLTSSHTAARTLTLPDATDTLVGKATTDVLTNKTLTSPILTSPVINTSVSGTAFLDDDTFATATADTLASSESIKAYVDTASAWSHLGTMSSTGSTTLGEITGIAAGYTELMLAFNGVGGPTGRIRVELGGTAYATTSSGCVHASTFSSLTGGPGALTTHNSTGSTRRYYGLISIRRLAATNSWHYSGSLGDSVITDHHASAGYISIATEFSKIKITSGAGNFAAGSAQVFGRK